MVEAYYRAQRALIAALVKAVTGWWSELDHADLSGSWSSGRTGERLFVATSRAQWIAVLLAERYVAQAVAEQTAGTESSAVLVPQSLVAVSSDGRDLETLLAEPLIATKAAIGGGCAPDRALRVGASALTRIVGTQVADAGRAATGVAMQVRPSVTSWVRMLSPPSCGRCAVLAGRSYRLDAGFSRHPLCDCVGVPSVRGAADEFRTDPPAYFRSLTREDQDRYFTVAGARAIRDGAAIDKVINARRGASGLSQPGRLTATELRTLRTAAGRRSLQRVDVHGRLIAVTMEGAAGPDLTQPVPAGTGKIPRLMPEAVYDLAGDDREEAVRLLRRFGYIA